MSTLSKSLNAERTFDKAKQNFLLKIKCSLLKLNNHQKDRRVQTHRCIEGKMELQGREGI
jgi:hypothetical protein